LLHPSWGSGIGRSAGPVPPKTVSLPSHAPELHAPEIIDGFGPVITLSERNELHPCPNWESPLEPGRRTPCRPHEHDLATPADEQRKRMTLGSQHAPKSHRLPRRPRTDRVRDGRADGRTYTSKSDGPSSGLAVAAAVASVARASSIRCRSRAERCCPIAGRDPAASPVLDSCVGEATSVGLTFDAS
jgi:hypothetical protein